MILFSKDLLFSSVVYLEDFLKHWYVSTKIHGVRLKTTVFTVAKEVYHSVMQCNAMKSQQITYKCKPYYISGDTRSICTVML